MTKNENNTYTGFAMPLALPDIYCKCANGWYDGLMQFLGIMKDNFYQSGHAMLLLINDDGDVFFFDFGRWHVLIGHGRLRGAETDLKLAFRTKAIIENNKILNINELLSEVRDNPHCNGVGRIFAAYSRINFEDALRFAHTMQDKPWLYGPFEPNGTNCTRSVRSIIEAGKPSFWQRLRLRTPYSITPTTMTIVRAMKSKMVQLDVIKPSVRPPWDKNRNVKGLINQPIRHADVPEKAIWHAGEGAGSWFCIEPKDDKFEISRFAVSGLSEGTALYIPQDDFDFHAPFEITFMSNSKQVNILQNEKITTLKRWTF